jgi:hypothetical protein
MQKLMHIPPVYFTDSQDLESDQFRWRRITLNRRQLVSHSFQEFRRPINNFNLLACLVVNAGAMLRGSPEHLASLGSNVGTTIQRRGARVFVPTQDHYQSRDKFILLVKRVINAARMTALALFAPMVSNVITIVHCQADWVSVPDQEYGLSGDPSEFFQEFHRPVNNFDLLA